MRVWLGLGALNGLIAVAAGAYGWHGLGGDDGAREMFEIAARYQMTHGLALLAVAWLAERRGATAAAIVVAGVSFALGIVLFSGSIYAFVLMGALPVEGAAPVGGGMLMLGWAAIIWAALTRG